MKIEQNPGTRRTRSAVHSAWDRTVLYLQNEDGSLRRKGTPGYATLLDGVLDDCQEGAIPLRLAGPLPLLPRHWERLRKWPIPNGLSSDREFSEHASTHSPGFPPLPRERVEGTFLLNPEQLFLAPAQTTLRMEGAAEIPTAWLLEEPPPVDDSSWRFRGEVFASFLDTGGIPPELAQGGAGAPPPVGAVWWLTGILPSTRFLNGAGAAILGATSPPLKMSRSVVIHADHEVTSAFALSDGRVRAGFAHRTQALSPSCLEDYLIRMVSGAQFEADLLLDGGFFAASRLTPSPLERWNTFPPCGPAAHRFSALTSPGLELPRPLDELGLLRAAGLPDTFQERL